MIINVSSYNSLPHNYKLGLKILIGLKVMFGLKTKTICCLQ